LCSSCFNSLWPARPFRWFELCCCVISSYYMQAFSVVKYSQLNDVSNLRICKRSSLTLLTLEVNKQFE
jgi:hypothetical protein